MANILVVGPHPDDQELGMGGTIALLADQGHRVLLLDVTDGEPTPFGDPGTRATESAAAAAALSALNNPVRRCQLGLRNRFVEHTIENRHKVAGAIRAWQAQVVFVPYFEDAHPDHLAVTRIVEDARFDAKLTKVEMPTPAGLNPGPPLYPRWLFSYYATHLRITPAPSFVVDVSTTIDRKSAAVAAYRSQFELNPKNRGVPEWLKAEAAYFGSRIGTAAGEPFFAREPLGLMSFDSLPI
ncbi:MAG: PIG-L family deacetylase [Phycisphaerales bacterium]